MQHIYQGTVLNLSDTNTVRHFIKQLRHSDFLMSRYDQERHNASYAYKWLPENLATTLESFCTDGTFGVFLEMTGQTKLTRRSTAKPTNSKKPATVPTKSSQRPLPALSPFRSPVRAGEGSKTRSATPKAASPYRSPFKSPSTSSASTRTTPSSGGSRTLPQGKRLEFTTPARTNQLESTDSPPSYEDAVQYMSDAEDLSIEQLHQGFINCKECNGQHQVYCCPALQDMGPEDQRKYIEEADIVISAKGYQSSHIPLLDEHGAEIKAAYNAILELENP